MLALNFALICFITHIACLPKLQYELLEDTQVGEITPCDGKCPPLSSTYVESSGSREIIKDIAFPKAFSSTPQVTAYLQSFKEYNQIMNWGIVGLQITNIDTKGFKLHISQWTQSSLAYLKVQWIATVNPLITIMEQQVCDVDKDTIEEYNFPQTFSQPPAVIAYFNMMERVNSLKINITKIENSKFQISCLKRTSKNTLFFGMKKEKYRISIIAIDQQINQKEQSRLGAEIINVNQASTKWTDKTLTQKVNSVTNNGSLGAFLYGITQVQFSSSLWIFKVTQTNFNSSSQLVTLKYEGNSAMTILNTKIAVITKVTCGDSNSKFSDLNTCECNLGFYYSTKQSKCIVCPSQCGNSCNENDACISMQMQANNTSVSNQTSDNQTDKQTNSQTDQTDSGANPSTQDNSKYNQTETTQDISDPSQDSQDTQNISEDQSLNENNSTYNDDQNSNNTSINQDLTGILDGLNLTDKNKESLMFEISHLLSSDEPLFDSEMIDNDLFVNINLATDIDPEIFNEIVKRLDFKVQLSNGTVVNVSEVARLEVYKDDKNSKQIKVKIEPFTSLKNVTMKLGLTNTTINGKNFNMVTEKTVEIVYKNPAITKFANMLKDFSNSDSKLVRIVEYISNLGIISTFLKVSQPIAQLTLLNYQQPFFSYEFQKIVAGWVFPIKFPNWMAKNQSRNIVLFFNHNGNDVIDERCWHKRQGYINLGNNFMIMGHFDLIIISTFFFLSAIAKFLFSKKVERISILDKIPALVDITDVKQLEIEEIIFKEFVKINEELKSIQVNKVQTFLQLIIFKFMEGRFAFFATVMVLSVAQPCFVGRKESVLSIFNFIILLLWILLQMKLFYQFYKLYKLLKRLKLLRKKCQQYFQIFYEAAIIKIIEDVEAIFRLAYPFFLKDKNLEKCTQIFQIFINQFKKLFFALILILAYNYPIIQLYGLAIIQAGFMLFRILFRMNQQKIYYVFKILEDILTLVILISKLIEFYLFEDFFHSNNDQEDKENSWQQSGYTTLWLEGAMIIFQNLQILYLILTILYGILVKLIAKCKQTKKPRLADSQVQKINIDFFPDQYEIPINDYDNYLKSIIFRKNDLIFSTNLKFKFQKKENKYLIDFLNLVNQQVNIAFDYRYFNGGEEEIEIPQKNDVKCIKLTINQKELYIDAYFTRNFIFGTITLPLLSDRNNFNTLLQSYTIIFQQQRTNLNYERFLLLKNDWQMWQFQSSMFVKHILLERNHLYYIFQPSIRNQFVNQKLKNFQNISIKCVEPLSYDLEFKALQHFNFILSYLQN